MKIKKNEAMFLIAFLGVIAALLVWLQVYKPYTEKTEALEAENREHAAYVAQLEEWARQVDFFREETERMVVEVNETFARFPVDSKAEDAIMYAVELEGQNPLTYISSVGVTEPEMLYEAAPTQIQVNTGEEVREHTYQLMRQQVTFTQEFTYDGMKRYVDSVVNDADRRSIETLNMAYDNTTGILVGTTTMNLFTLQGRDAAYRETQIPTRNLGTANIFGTIRMDEAVIGGDADFAEE